jgi:hypothetical protein
MSLTRFEPRVIESTRPTPSPAGRRLLLAATVAVVLVGGLFRANVVLWSEPWTPHQVDEHILGPESLALWEGITPREVGWPGSTTRLIMSSIAAVQWVADDGTAAWQLRQRPDEALSLVSDWIARRLVDPKPLYKLGRTVAMVTGVLQLMLLVWTLRQWTGPIGVVLGTLATAVSPLAIVYSQLVLADITALFFATLLLGLAARPTPRRVAVMGALGGLAAASKFHFGLWALSALLAAIGMKPYPLRTRLLAVGTAAGLFVWVLITFVPWTWMNPLLAMKEFTGVVLVKIGEGQQFSNIAQNVYIVLLHLGSLTLVGAVLSLVLPSFQLSFSNLGRVVVPAATGLAFLAASETVFDRYGLVLLPGLSVMAAVGWNNWVGTNTGRKQTAAFAVLVLCTAATLHGAVMLQRTTGDVHPDVLSAQWVLAHVERGKRVAMYDENNAQVPWVRDQLQECSTYSRTPEAYARKWRVEGIQTNAEAHEPMRSVVLTDEDFQSYVCRRMLSASVDPGYRVVLYHPEFRFDAVLEDDVLADFRSGGTDRVGGVDVLMINHPVDVGVAPAFVAQSRLGRRFIYVRPGSRL